MKCLPIKYSWIVNVFDENTMRYRNYLVLTYLSGITIAMGYTVYVYVITYKPIYYILNAS